MIIAVIRIIKIIRVIGVIGVINVIRDITIMGCWFFAIVYKGDQGCLLLGLFNNPNNHNDHNNPKWLQQLNNDNHHYK